MFQRADIPGDLRSGFSAWAYITQPIHKPKTNPKTQNQKPNPNSHHLRSHISQSLLFRPLIVQFGEHVEEEISVGADAYYDRELLIGDRKLECTAVYFDD